MSSPNFQREFRLPLKYSYFVSTGNVASFCKFSKCYTVLTLHLHFIQIWLLLGNPQPSKSVEYSLELPFYQWDCVKDWVILSPKLASQYSVVVIYLLGPPPPAYQEQFRVLERYKAWNSGKNIDTNICHQNRSGVVEQSKGWNRRSRKR